MFYDNIDWLHYFDMFADGGMELADETLKEWCITASEIALMQVPEAENRFTNGHLSERVFAYVIINMVVRKLRYGAPVKESNGTYSYQMGEPSDTSMPNITQYGRSPNLYISKSERELLSGGASTGTLGGVRMSVAPGSFI